MALVITVVVALVGTLIYAYNHCDTLREKANLLFENILNGVRTTYEFIVNTTNSLWEIISPIWNIIKDTGLFILSTLLILPFLLTACGNKYELTLPQLINEISHIENVNY